MFGASDRRAFSRFARALVIYMLTDAAEIALGSFMKR